MLGCLTPMDLPSKSQWPVRVIECFLPFPCAIFLIFCMQLFSPSILQITVEVELDAAMKWYHRTSSAMDTGHNLPGDALLGPFWYIYPCWVLPLCFSISFSSFFCFYEDEWSVVAPLIWLMVWHSSKPPALTVDWKALMSVWGPVCSWHLALCFLGGIFLLITLRSSSVLQLHPALWPDVTCMSPCR